MENDWCEPLMRCAEGLYVIEENSRRVVWLNDYMKEKLDAACVGEHCWRVLLGRETQCPFCPRLTEEDDVYSWEFFSPRHRRWMKVKNLLFRREGVLYRAGNINMVDDMMRLNHETVQEISTLQTVLSKSQGEMAVLEKEAVYDTLTGLFNRNCFQMDLKQEYSNVAGLGVLYFDLNNLKETNDCCGHEIGDELLCRQAKAMHHAARYYKSYRGYRIGGDEFVLLLAGCTQAELTRCGERFAAYLDSYNQNEAYPCSVAMGSAFSEAACQQPELLISLADSDMYRVKRAMKELENININ